MGRIGRRGVLVGAAGAAAAFGGSRRVGAQARPETLVIGQSSDISTLDPAFAIDIVTRNVLFHIYDTVLWRRPDGSIGPHLATAVDNVSPTEWRVMLAPGRKFANGEAVDAEAVRFSLARLTDNATKSPNRSLFDQVVSAKVESPTSLLLTTKAPDALLTARLSQLMVVPPKHAQSAKLNEAPVGSGPYALVEWRRNEVVSLAANPAWWGPAPAFRKVAVRAIPEEIARISAVKTGEAHLVTSVSPNQGDALTRAGDVQVLRSESTRVMVLQFNAAMEPAGDVRFRRAVALAVNRDEIVRGLMKGYATETRSIFAGAVQGVPKDVVGAFESNPAEARKIIGELGLEGKEVELSGGAGHFPLDREIALAVGAQLRRVGLNVKVRPEEYGTFLADVKKRTIAPVFIQPHGNVWLDPMPQFIAFFASDGFISGWRDPALDAMIAKANGLLGAEREAMVGLIARKLYDDVAAVPLFAYQFIYAAAPWLKWQPRADDVIVAREIG